MPGRTVRLQKDRTRVAVPNLEFVECAWAQVGYVEFPHAVASDTHRMTAAVPTVEVTDNADSPRIGRPDREQHAGHAPHFALMRAEKLVGLAVGAARKELEICIPELRRIGVRIVSDVLAMIRVSPNEPVSLGHD
jgi:hypothetical protein